MWDYADVVVATASTLPRPIAICGWSMGGLVVLLAAERVHPTGGVVLVEPSPPAEVQGVHPAVRPSSGSFDPEEVYGRFPPGIASRPESALARGERKLGIAVPSLPCRSLVVYGQDFPEERGRRIATLYGSDELSFPELDHWGLVLDSSVPDAVARWLGVARRSSTLPAP